MDFSFINLALAFGAGLVSIASPCVLPVVPIIVTGSSLDHKHRPLMIVVGLSFSFMLMGVLSSLFGSLIGSWMLYIEKGAGALIIVFGLLMLFDINPFKHLSRLQTIHGPAGRGLFSGVLLGATLGVIWIPCIGPMLSGVLAKVAVQGELTGGLVLLGFYSAGFAVPMLIAGYASQFFRSRLSQMSQHPGIVRWLSGAILIALGAYILIAGAYF